MITVIKPGLLTTVQDLGRFGYQKFGVIAGGAMDPLAHRIANLLVGNDENCATLEITLAGPVLRFRRDAFISICGGDLSAEINGKPVRRWRAVLVKEGATLSFGPCRSGCRAYLAVAGGISVPAVMGSRSTYLRAEIGGFRGRALRAGDQLEAGGPSGLSQKMIRHLEGRFKEDFVEGSWTAPPKLLPALGREFVLRTVLGRQFGQFREESRRTFFAEAYRVTPQSDRMGYRLDGPPLVLADSKELLSEAVNVGTVQVPPDGKPIVLMADRQTTGGYPKIGQVISVDLSLLAQAKPGDFLRFREISLREAQSLYLLREKEIRRFREGIAIRFK